MGSTETEKTSAEQEQNANATPDEADIAAAEGDVAEDLTGQLGIEVGDSPFSLDLSQDQEDIRDWAHGFAEQTVRPAAHEWDEREEFPWPVVQEAAKIGMYGFESVAQFWADPDRADLPDRERGAFLGRRRDRDVDLRHDPRGRRDLLERHARADDGVGPAVLRHRRRRQGRGVLRLRARRRLRRLGLPHARQVRRGQGRVGHQRPEGVGDQRRHRQRPRRDRLGRPRPRLARPRGLRHPAGHQGLRAGRQGEEARDPRQPHRRRPPRRLPHPRLVPAGRQGEARREARPRPRGHQLQGAGGDEDLRGLAADRRARRPSASPAPPTSTRWTTPRSARRSGGRSSRTSRSRSTSPT